MNHLAIKELLSQDRETEWPWWTYSPKEFRVNKACIRARVLDEFTCWGAGQKIIRDTVRNKEEICNEIWEYWLEKEFDETIRHMRPYTPPHWRDTWKLGSSTYSAFFDPFDSVSVFPIDN